MSIRKSIEWINNLPVNWSAVQLKYLLASENGAMKVGPFGTQLSGNDFTDEGYWVYNQRTVVNQNFEDNTTFISEEKYNSMKGFQVEADDILITSRGTIGKICRVPQSFHKGIIHPCIIKFRIDDSKILYSIVRLLFNESDIIKEQLLYMSNATTIDVVYSSSLKNVFLPVAPIKMQHQISSYLDAKCTEIDSLSADIQSQIDTLEQYKRSVITEAVTKGLDKNVEMKDSGLQWIGDMPAHWDCLRGKYILKYLQKPVREEDGVITCFRDGEVTLRSNRREDGFTMSDKEIGYQGIDIGDLVVHGMDGFAGAIGISDSRGKGSPVLNVLDTDQNKKYIMYYLRSMAYGDVFTALATGIRVRSCDLRWNKLAELMYPVPPIPEQEQIVNYIDDTLSKTNSLIKEKEQQLSTLDAYKKSLIYEYVTGKKEVPVS
jgi:type I restriction enzyme S subunit